MAVHPYDKESQMSDKPITRKILQQHSTQLQDDEGGEGESGGGGLGVPEIDLYELHETIRAQHKGKVEAARKFHERIQQNNNQTAAFDNDKHPLAAMAYFSGIDNQDETPLPGESTDEDIRNELEYTQRLRLQKQLGLTNSTTPTPRPP